MKRLIFALVVLFVFACTKTENPTTTQPPVTVQEDPIKFTTNLDTGTYNVVNPPSLQVNAPNDQTNNIAQFYGNTDNYSQVGITNANGGTTASSDLALYNDLDSVNQLSGYISR